MRFLNQNLIHHLQLILPLKVEQSLEDTSGDLTVTQLTKLGSQN